MCKPLLVVAASAAVMIAPWMVKNTVLLRNPVSPFLNRVFPNPYVHISFEKDYAYHMRHYGLKSDAQIPLEVTVKGEVDPRSGFVVDLKQLKETMHREVLDAMDHRFLNKEVPEFATRIPTTENLAIAIWQRLAPKLTAAKLHRVRVYENHDLFVDFYGEE